MRVASFTGVAQHRGMVRYPVHRGVVRCPVRAVLLPAGIRALQR